MIAAKDLVRVKEGARVEEKVGSRKVIREKEGC